MSAYVLHFDVSAPLAFCYDILHTNLRKYSVEGCVLWTVYVEGSLALALLFIPLHSLSRALCNFPESKLLTLLHVIKGLSEDFTLHYVSYHGETCKC